MQDNPFFIFIFFWLPQPICVAVELSGKLRKDLILDSHGDAMILAKQG